jgi:hypothetical protein
MPAPGINRLPAEKSSGHPAHDAAYQPLLDSELIGDLILGVNSLAAEPVAHSLDSPIAFRQCLERSRWQGFEGAAEGLQA